MEKYYYIKKSTIKTVISFADDIADSGAEVGSTWDDFNNNKWILLTEDQVNFYNENKNASKEEVFNMQINPPVEPTIDELKFEKLMQIEDYDRSSNVNSFSINGTDMWLTVDERQQLATLISANESIGRSTMTRWFNGVEFTFPINTWRQMLTALEVYAGDALNTTESHKAAVNAFTTKEEIESYDITAGYPDKLSF